MKRFLFLLPLLLFLLCAPCLALAAESGDAEEEQDWSAALGEQMDASGASGLYDETPDEAKQLLGELGVESLDYKALLSLTPADFFKTVWGLICETARRPLVILAAITGVAVLCSMVEGLKTSLGGSGLDSVFGVVAVLCICTVVIAPVVDCVTLAAQAIASCSDFILSFIPVFISLVAVGGQPVGATTYNSMMLFVSQIISTVTTSTLVPLICVYLAFCLVGALTPNNNLEGAAKTAKSVVTWSLGLLVTVFVGLLGLQSLVAAGADSVSMRAGKFLISSFVPVVGKALSDALATAQGCVRMLKTTVGAYAILAAVLNFLPSLVKTAVWYCATGLGAAVCDVLGATRIGKVLRACGSALSLLLGIIAFVALLFIISTTIMLVTGMGGST